MRQELIVILGDILALAGLTLTGGQRRDSFLAEIADMLPEGGEEK